MTNLYITSGDDYADSRALTITVTDPAGAAVDLTATDLTFMVKASRTDADEDALITKTLLDGIELATQSGDTEGVAYLTLEAADTEALDGRYRWELQGEDSDGTITLAGGVLFVEPDLITA